MEDIGEQWDALSFSVQRSVRYHERRRNFYETWSMLTSGASLLFGSAAIATVLKGHENWVVFFSLLVAVLSTVDLVIGTTKMAHSHSDLGKRFIDLQKKMTLCSKPTADDYNSMCADRLDIEKDEPPIKRIVDVICHNELVYALGYPETAHLDVPWYKRLTAHFINWHNRPLTKPSKEGANEEK